MRSNLWQWRLTLLTTTLGVSSFVITLSIVGWLQLLEWAFLDQFFRWRPLEPKDQRIVVVGIDESDIANLGQWPMSDRQLAQLLDKIISRQPIVIGLDLYRDLPVEPGYEALAQIFATTPNLIGIKKVSGGKVNPPKILSQKKQVGIADVALDEDGKIRRGLLFQDDPQGVPQETLGMKLALNYLQNQNIQPNLIDQKKLLFRLGKTLFSPLKPRDGGYAGAKIGGYQVLLNLRGASCGSEGTDPNCPFTWVSMSQVLNDRIDPDLMEGRIVLIGPTAPSLNDFFYAAYSKNDETAYTGVEIHAHVASQVISAALDGRGLIQTVPEPIEWLWIVLWTGMSASLGVCFLQWRWQITIALISTAFGLVLIAYCAFLAGWWLPIFAPLLGVGGATIASISYVLLKNLQDYTQTLERKVEERTAELQLAKQAADRANRMKSEFLAGMSHELRTPLNAILGFTRIMAKMPTPNSEFTNYLGIVGRSGEHLLSLINDVLDLSKIEAGKITLDVNQFDLYQLLKTIEEMLKMRANAKKLELSFDLDSNLPQYIQTDEKKLKQVLINLLGNAIKFTEQGQIILKVQGSAPHINFQVQDTGAGIAPEEMDRLFEAFGQTASGRQSQEGTGLGLPISRRFVQLMGGDIEVTSVVGQGTTFAFTIDVQTADAMTVQALARKKEAWGSVKLQPGQSYRLLVVDDRPENRLLLAKLLGSIGCDVQEAANGRDAVEIWQKWQPQLIWMDIQMPIMDGYEATRQIRKLEQQASGNLGEQNGNFPGLTKIIAVTANALVEARSEMLEAGCDDIVYKPFQEQTIFDKLTEHLDVQYQFEESTPSEEPPVEILETLSPDALREISPDWIKALHQAAIAGDDERVLQLVQELPPSHAAVTATLRAWIEDFRFDKVTELTEQILTAH
jgi:CHASE2 domain-containing sensor protein/nitrogen-specific signal transduction histidine kinase/DNA-binding NarL/FixJ family response regulator